MRILRAIGRWWYRFINYMVTWEMHRDAVKHLNKLTDRELKDIGLNRGDIDRMRALKKINKTEEIHTNG
ncbi:MAG: DUF1127 domain-containing protein [Flavobacteriaceae bacterium]|nr:DUF1127 domain-containing protein [Flavobacteriaceae bacterium]